ncbi:hypothetical protein [Thermospira aquatica]|uniref:Uncharacterized protein n=1 Tax=Thermospira aquatica TaxID=2828656 RepID=A0AAX3BBA4_9SPIR|nr:hypothetical protein [Thermospira aquatica]URA09535.1 hypothetical protein KDW03_08555 [Thermospira aquatica]
MKRVIFLTVFFSGMMLAKPLTWNKNIEYIMGFYDVGLSTSFTFYYISWLSWQLPTIRWNPFAMVMTFETSVRYFPFSQFNVSFWVFHRDEVSPYLFTGVKVPHTFQTVGVPFGLGLLQRWGSFSVHGRVYGDFVMVPIFDATWSFELAGSFTF